MADASAHKGGKGGGDESDTQRKKGQQHRECLSVCASASVFTRAMANRKKWKRETQGGRKIRETGEAAKLCVPLLRAYICMRWFAGVRGCLFFALPALYAPELWLMWGLGDGREGEGGLYRGSATAVAALCSSNGRVHSRAPREESDGKKQVQRRRINNEYRNDVVWTSLGDRSCEADHLSHPVSPVTPSLLSSVVVCACVTVGARCMETVAMAEEAGNSSETQKKAKGK